VIYADLISKEQQLNQKVFNETEHSPAFKRGSKMTSKSSIMFVELKVTDSLTLPQSDKQSMSSSMSDDMLNDLDVGYNSQTLQHIEPVKTMRIQNKPVFDFKNQHQLYEVSERSPHIEKENSIFSSVIQVNAKIIQTPQRKRAQTNYN
jgi:hypothetical protein